MVAQLAVVCFLLQEMHTRNETLLQMYGEKSEQAEELRLDLIDVKEMYRQQVRENNRCVTYACPTAQSDLSATADPRPAARERSRLALVQ